MVIGNLGSDPELRYTQGGQPVLGLRIAATETYLDRNKVKQERTEWVSVTIWGKRGEALHKLIAKGSRIFIEGSLHTSSWEDKQGNKRYKTEVNASNVILLDGKRDGASRQETAASSQDTEAPCDDLVGDDIPF
jgi:single-strand DNA-binding protein